MKAEAVVAILERRLRGKSQKKLAQELGVSQTYLHFVLKGRQAAGPKILKALGLEAVETYRKVNLPAVDESTSA